MRFCVAVAAGLRRMVPPSVEIGAKNSSNTEDAGDHSYGYFVECFVGSFLQESLHAALQNRGNSAIYRFSPILKIIVLCVHNYVEQVRAVLLL